MPTFELAKADGVDLAWAREVVERYHYLHKAPDPRGRPFCYVARLRGLRVACLWFGRPESTACYCGGLTYGGREAVAGGRAEFDRWEVLNLARVWVSPECQPGGRLFGPDWLPGFVDRRGYWRPALASHLIRLALGRVGFDYLLAQPPCFLDQPYVIRAVLSYCDTRLHRGTIYPAAGFALARRNEDGVETYWTRAVAPLTETQDAAIRSVAQAHPRSVRLREAARSLF